MKRNLFTSIFLSLLLSYGIASKAFAGECDAPSSPEPAAGIFGESKNVIKMNLSSLALTSFNFQAERALFRNFSVALQASIAPKRELSFLPAFITDEDPTNILKTSQLSAFSLTPEIRFYLSVKGAPRGFYIAAYGRYTKLKITNTLSYAYSSSGTTYTDQHLDMAGTKSGMGFGIMLGHQWIIAKHLSIDWFILGGHYGSGTINVAGTSNSTLSPDAQSAIQAQLSLFKAPLLSNQQVDVNSHGATFKADFPTFGIRAVGLNIGFAF